MNEPNNPLLEYYVINDAIQTILEYFDRTDNYTPTEDDLSRVHAIFLTEPDKFMEVLRRMITLDIMEEARDSQRRFRLTKFGLDLLAMGGWHKHLELEEIKRDKIRKEYKDIKRRAKLFWPAALIALLSGGITIFDKIGHVFELILQYPR
jgi:hypothetical protein